MLVSWCLAVRFLGTRFVSLILRFLPFLFLSNVCSLCIETSSNIGKNFFLTFYIARIYCSLSIFSPFAFTNIITFRKKYETIFSSYISIPHIFDLAVLQSSFCT